MEYHTTWNIHRLWKHLKPYINTINIHVIHVHKEGYKMATQKVAGYYVISSEL